MSSAGCRVTAGKLSVTARLIWPENLALAQRHAVITAFDRFADALRVLVALGGVMLYTGVKGEANELIPLMLGVIASALAETNDSWRRRAQALLLTLVCFSVAAFVVEALLDWRWLFMLVMLGAASGRYATIANATLLLSVYTMIGVQQNTTPDAPFWYEPLLLVLGAGWYGVLALAWNTVSLQGAHRGLLSQRSDVPLPTAVARDRAYLPAARHGAALRSAAAR